MEHEISKHLPRALQPYERCLREGAAMLNDAELLAVILRTGSVGENSLELAARLLTHGTLAELFGMTTEQLTSVKGIGRVKAIQLQCVGEAARRISIAGKEEIIFNSPYCVGSYYMEKLRDEVQEQVILVMLNNKGALIRDVMLTKGTVNHAILSPREVFIEALRYHAVKIIIVHNHPSGDPTPSTEDISVTIQIQKAGELTAIPLIDHIIVGADSYVSLKERGYIS